MENRKFIKILTIIFILGFFILSFNDVFAYEIKTHAYLTSEIIKFYNQNFPNNKIPDDLVPYLLDGSRREDDAPRWMNHFYDPVKDRGLTRDPAIDPFYNSGVWQKSKDWAQDSNNQNSLTYKVPATIASILTAIQQKTISALITETDFTWQKAIKLYVQGEKEKAMFVLGHILHLIEDTSVPDHTRNDPHPGDSPYENYTSQFNLVNPDKNLNSRLINKTPVVFHNLNSYFDELANYSNNNFYSKDTIGMQSGYNLPEVNLMKYKIINGLYYLENNDGEGNEYFLAVKTSLNNALVTTKFDITIDNAIIKNDYWSRLSVKSIQYGAGVINLFFQEAEKAKNDQNFSEQKEEKSFLSKAIDTAKNLFIKINNFFSDIANNNNRFQPAGQITLNQTDNQTNEANKSESAAAVQSIKHPNPEQSIKQSNQSQNKTQSQNKNNSQTSSNQESSKNKKSQSPQIIEEDEEGYDEQQDLQEQLPDNQLTEQKEPLKQLKQSPSPVGKECSFNTNQSPLHQKVIINEVAWMGTLNSANDEWIELKNISNSEVDLNNWQLIDQGEQIKINLGLLKKTKIPAGGFVLLERTNDDSVPKIAADLIYVGSLSNSNEGLRLFDNQCNLIDEVLAKPNWPAGDSALRRTMERLSNLSWHTYSGAAQNNIFGTPKKENSQPVISDNGNGGSFQNSNKNNSSSNSSNNNQALVQYPKILINEIKINPAGERFIELYNPNNSAVDLTNWYLQRKTQSGSSFGSLVSKTYFENKTISPYGYFLISREPLAGADIVLENLTLTESNTIQLKNPQGEIVDKVGWGNSGDCETNCAAELLSNQSIQRKFQNNIFIDTDNNFQDFEIQTCPSPKAPSQTCQSTQSNQAPGAFFVNHLLISEIMPSAGTGRSNEEFIELYNPTDNPINLTGYSLKRRTSLNSISLQTLVKSEDFKDKIIPAKGFFLIASPEYQASSSPDIIYSSSYRLANNDDTVALYNENNEIVDEINYSSIEAGKSLERKAWQNNVCFSSQLNGEFLGNGCDTDNNSDFEIRQIPKPQNSQSLPEPRNAPIMPQNFSIQYSSTTMSLNLNWSASKDYNGAASAITYKIIDISDSSSTFPIPEMIATSTKLSIGIKEVGRNYQFSIQAFDKDGLGSAVNTTSITVPGFLSKLYFYQNPQTTSSLEYLIDLYYNTYPFIPPKYQSNISGLVFYLNQKNPPAPESINLGNLSGCRWDYHSMPEAMKIYYPNYSFYQSSSGTIAVLPNILEPIELYRQLYGVLPSGVYQYIINRDQLEDNHLRFFVRENFSVVPTSQDYLKIAFYSYTTDRSQCEQALVAVDQTEYHFQQNFPFSDSLPLPPKTPSNFKVNFNQQSEKPHFELSWDASTDSDSLDKEIIYFLSYYPENEPQNKQEWKGQSISTEIIPLSSGTYVFELKACDEFNLCSENISASAKAIVPVVLVDTTNYSNWNSLSFGVNIYQE